MITTFTTVLVTETHNEAVSLYKWLSQHKPKLGIRKVTVEVNDAYSYLTVKDAVISWSNNQP